MSSKLVRWREIGHHWEVYLFIVPAMVLIALFQYYPAASGIFHSFYRWNGADVSEFVGLQNYLDLFQSAAFWDSFRVAFVLGFWNVLKMAPAILVAVLIHRCRNSGMQYLYRILFVIPMVIPGLVIALIWRSFFFEANSGFLNQFLHATGIFNLLCKLDAIFGWGNIFVPGTNPAWLGDPRLILIACIVWGFPWVGSFAVLTHLAKLQSIPKELYEAGSIDGANWWSQFRRIELPLIMGSIYLQLVFVIIATIKDAGTILALAGIEGGPGGAVTVPALFMLRKAFVAQEMGAACAIGIVLTAVVLSLQKLSTLVLEENPAHRHHTMLHPLVFLAGATLIYTGKWPVGGVFLCLLVLPYSRMAGFIRRNFLQFLEREKNPRAPVLWNVQATAPPRIGWLLRFQKHATLWVILGLAFLPLYLMVIVSLKSNQQFYEFPTVPTQPFHWENWNAAVHAVMPSVANSMFISISSTFLTLFFALCAAYFFARYRMPLSGVLWNALLLLMMMPSIANLVPLFRLLADLNLLNTLSGLIVVGASAGQVFAIFVLRNFVEDIPQDLFEAAEVDGASHIRQMFVVVLPLCGPILGTVGVMHFINEWNEFVLPLIVMRDSDKLPVMVQLLRMAGEYVKFWGPLMAGYATASIPIILLFIFTMRLFVKGLTEGSVKG